MSRKVASRAVSHTQKNGHFTREMRTFWGNKEILSGPQLQRLVLRLRLELR